MLRPLQRSARELTRLQAAGPLGLDDAGVVAEDPRVGSRLGSHVMVRRLAPVQGQQSEYPTAALEAASSFTGSAGEFPVGTVVRLAHGYSACGDAEAGPLSFAGVGVVTGSRASTGSLRVVPLATAGAAAAYPRAALRSAAPPADRVAPVPPLRVGDLVRATAAARTAAAGTPTGLFVAGEVGVVIADEGDTLLVELMAREPSQPGWLYQPAALERAPWLESDRIAAEPPMPPLLRMGDYARLAAGATRIRGAGHEETGGDEENQDVDNSASAWLQPGELAIVVYVRGRRADVVARRIGDRNTRTYAPGALEPAPPPPQLAVGDRVVLCPYYRGPLPSLARGPALELEHVGAVVSVDGAFAARRIRVATPSGNVRSYRARALERARVPRPVKPPDVPPPRILLPMHGHPIGALVHVWTSMLRYGGSCDCCGRQVAHASSARCTMGCGFDLCAPCLRTLIASAPGGDAIDAAVQLYGDDVTAAQLLAAAGTTSDEQPAALPPPQPQQPSRKRAAPEPASAGGGASWSFFDIPAPQSEAEPDALAIAKLRACVAACALHGAVPQADEEVDECVAMDSDAESELELESEGEGDQRRGMGVPKTLRIYRDALVESSMASLGHIGGDAWRRPTQVYFHATAGAPREEGADGGGLTREWYSVVARALMELPVICPTDNEAREYYFNPARCSPSDLAQCEFLGAFLGRALLDGSVRERVRRLRHVTLSGVRLCDAFYAVLLGRTLTLADVAHVSAAEYRALRAILDADVTPDLCLGTFEHRVFAPGAPPGASPLAVLPLRPGGSSLPITNANKAEFVLLKAQSVVMTSVARQLDAACAGFYSIVPASALRASKLTPRQLRRLLCGAGCGFNVAELRQMTRYDAPYSAEHPVVAWLWELLAEAGHALQSDFLEFTTGAAEPPAAGFAAMRGSGNAPPLTVRAAPLRSDGAAEDAPPRLPTARTCSNTFELPPYDTKATLRDKLREALAQKNTFGFV